MQWDFYSARDEERAEEIHNAFKDDKIDAIFCARGGIGSLRLMRYLDVDIIRENPKVFVGYSDITPIQIYLFEKVGLISFQGWMPAVYPSSKEDISAIEKSIEVLMRILVEGEAIELKNPSDAPLMQYVNYGTAEGRIIGGNIILFTLLMSTKYSPKINRRIVFLENIEEHPWRVENYLSTLELTGKLRRASGFIFGEFPEPSAYDYPSPSTIEIIIDHFRRIGKPTIINYACCHGRYKLPIPIGGNVKIDTEELSIRFMESMVD
jgi:muramoyltetrapeptide carboxypeptidase